MTILAKLSSLLAIVYVRNTENRSVWELSAKRASLALNSNLVSLD